jgi:rod shape-determining protein MreC
MRMSSARTWQTAVILFIVVGLIALALGGYMTPVSRIIMAPIISAQTWVSTRFVAIQSFIKSPQDMVQMRQRVDELEAENARLESEIIDLEQQLSETHILSALVDFARVHPENRYVATSVIGRDPSPFVKYVIINRGSDDGLRRGMPIVTSQGLVGRVSAVTAGAGRVELITNPSSSINVRLEPNGVQAVLSGSVTGELTINMVAQTADVKAGDLVLTSGLGGNYPGNILIGQVTTVRRRETDLFQSATVQPVVDFNNLQILLVIINFRPVDIGPLVPTPATPQ